MFSDDPTKQFDDLKGKLLKQIESTFPVSDRKDQLEVRVRDLSIEDKHGVDDIESQHKAKVYGRSWTAPVKGTLEVVDKKTGKVLSTRENVQVASVPKLTRHYSYIIGGQEKQVANQWRLKPGAYVRPTEKEGEFTAQFQMAKGRSFKMNLDPASGYMHMAVGGRKVPVYSVLSASGVSDDEMRKMWGPDAFEANKKKASGDKDIISYYKAATGKVAPKNASPKDLLGTIFSKTEMDPEVTKDTLGKGYSALSSDALAKASAKLLNVSAKKEDPDPIDSLKYKELWTAGDQFVERVSKSQRNIHHRIQQPLQSLP